MKAYKPYVFLPGETLSPSKVWANLRRLSLDVKSSMDRRYTYSSFVLDFSGLTDTSTAAEKRYSFTPPLAFDIVGMELEVYAASPLTSVSLVVTRSGLTSPVLAADVLGATTRSYTVSNFNFDAPASGQVSFTLTTNASSTPWTLTSCKVIVHVRTDRGNDGANYDPYIPNLNGNVNTGVLTSHTTLNTEFTSLAAAVARDTAHSSCMRMEMRTWRNIAAGAFTTDMDRWKLPAAGRASAQISGGVVCPNTSSVRFSWNDKTGAELGGVTVVGTGSVNVPATGQTLFSATVAAGTITSLADDETARIARVVGTDAIPFAYSVLFWV